MQEKLTQASLEAMSQEKRNSLVASLNAEIAALSATEALSEADTKRLEKCKATIAMIEQIGASGEGKAEGPEPKVATYVPEKGAEKKVHAIIRKGSKFDSETGKRLGIDEKQYFSFGEWRAFKNNCSSLGYEIVKILYNPFEE